MTTQATLDGDAAPAPSGGSVRFPSLFAFVGSGTLLVLELAAGRILAPAIGVSLYTWTSIIGVVLAGISLGNWLGGRLADRRPERRILALLYLLAAITSSFILAFSRRLDLVEAPHSWPAWLQVLWLAILLFFLPSTILGMTTPLLVKLSLNTLGEAGRVVGRIQAMATAGSIVGTFATGFFLVSTFGTRAVVAGVCVTLFLLAILAAPKGRRAGAQTVVAVLFLTGTAAIGRGCDEVGGNLIVVRESNYSCIRVTIDPYDPSLRTLQLDFLLHGYVDMDEPAKLIYGYERLYGEVLASLYPPGAELDSFHVGGGTYTFPRHLAARNPGRIVVAEIDPAVTEVAHEHLGLARDAPMEIVHDDARRVIIGLDPGERFDLFVTDAFNDLSVPFHLTTLEFDRTVASHLRPGGTYLVNLADGVDYDFLRASIRTLREVFRDVRLAVDNTRFRVRVPDETGPGRYRDAARAAGIEPADVVAGRDHMGPYVDVLAGILDDGTTERVRDVMAAAAGVGPDEVSVSASWPLTGRRETFVLVASDERVPETDTMVPPAELDAFLAPRPGILLTDDFVPVDQLLAPVFRQRVEF